MPMKRLAPRGLVLLGALLLAATGVAEEASPAAASGPTNPVAAGNDTGSARNIRILALDRILPGAKEERLKTLLPEEAKAVLNLYLSGVIHDWWFRQDRPGAVFLLEAHSVDDARRILGQLPLAREGLIDYDLVPVGPYIPLATMIPPEPAPTPKKKGFFRKK